MREIKFRYIVKHIASGNIETKVYTLSQIEERPLKSLSPVFIADYELLGKSLYTGLKDKNGKEIYEGDILSDKTIVKYGFASCGCCEYVWGYDFDRNYIDDGKVYTEVIGNIYKNPELVSE